jgi:diguanylate cyclase (GGDEF)-like protein
MTPMDPTTAMWIALLMMLLNGGVLGLMHRDFPPELRPAAISWRIGTLLQACGCVLLALQSELPVLLTLPVANALLMLGLTGYWRALRQFYGYAESYWLLLPVVLGTLGVSWFALIDEDFPLRVVCASLAWLLMLLGCIWTLRSRPARASGTSRHVLTGIFGLVAVFMLLRMVYFLSIGNAPASLIDKGSWVNVVTPMIAAVTPVIGTTAFLLLCSQRITRSWEIAAATDYLTGLANRRTVVSMGDAQFLRAAESAARPTVLVLDIDYFKRINDTHGHAVGDLAIQHVASHLQAACAPGVAGRLGGEEFVALFADLDPGQARRIAEDLRRSIQDAPLRIGASSVPISMTVSIGLASRVPEDREFAAMLQRADQALYAAKSSGRNRVAYG